MVTEESLARIHFKDCDHDPYVRMGARLFKVPEMYITGITRFLVKANLFCIDIEAPLLEYHGKILWEHYDREMKIYPHHIADEDEFFEHFLFITEDIYNEYPGWYDLVTNQMGLYNED